MARAVGWPVIQLTRFSQLTVNSLVSPGGGHSLEACVGFPGRDGIADTELPSPQIGLDLHKGKLHAPAVHESGVGDATFASSSANNFMSI